MGTNFKPGPDPGLAGILNGCPEKITVYVQTFHFLIIGIPTGIGQQLTHTFRRGNRLFIAKFSFWHGFISP
jgi:hypothetical protein